MKKAFLNWSSGKDAAYALFTVQNSKEYKVEKLLTTINSQTNRISMHGVRKDLLMKQEESIGLPLQVISLDGNIPLKAYNHIMQKELNSLKKEGFTQSIFGDILLEDLRQYRETELKKVGVKAVFPIWKADTRELIFDILEAGFKVITVCVNANLLDQSFCGRIIDHKFLEDLPAGIDPCGENGEFHTFVFDGPVFTEPIKYKVGETVKRSYNSTEEKDDCFTETEAWDTGFWYTDLLPI